MSDVDVGDPVVLDEQTQRVIRLNPLQERTGYQSIALNSESNGAAIEHGGPLTSDRRGSHPEP
jgi:hypothetical protein